MDVTSQVKTLLDKLKCQIDDQARWLENVKEACEFLSFEYQKLNQANRNPIDYQSPVIQFAYIYKYVICHADFLYQLLHKVLSNPLSLAETDGEIRITCLGVGPGSDILGFRKFLSEVDVQRNLKFLLCDGEENWKNTWNELYIEDGIELSSHFINFTRKSEWNNKELIFNSDFFTMIFFVSEIYNCGGDIRSFFLEIFSKAKPGAVFLYIDNAMHDLRGFYDDLTTESRLERIYSDDKQRLQWSLDERKNKLNPYFERLNHQPKIGSYVDMRVYRKPDPDHAA